MGDAPFAPCVRDLRNAREASVGVTGEMAVNVDNKDDDDEKKDEDKEEYNDSRISASRSVL
jgi:hypothetical protein